MSAQPSVEELLSHVRERVQARGPQRITSFPAKSVPGPGRSNGPMEFNFSELRRNVLDASTYHAMVGQLNPRAPGLLNRGVQFVKKVMRRSLSWYTRPLHLFQGSVARSLEQSSKGIQHNYTRILQLQSQIRVVDDEQKNVVRKFNSQIANHDKKLEAVEAGSAKLMSQMKVIEDARVFDLDATRAALAAFEERVGAAEQRVAAAEQWSRTILRTSDSHLGAKAQAGLWFNPPLAIDYDDKDQATWAGTTERIVERAWMLRQLSMFAPGAHLLDVGSNESTLALELASNGYRVTALDVRPYPLLHPNLQVVQGDICDSGLPPEAFDGIISLSTIEHIGVGAYGDPKSDLLSTAIAQIHRLLKPNGKFFITAPFGVATVTELHRIFDSESFRTVLAGFQIEKLEFGRKINDKTWLSPVPEDSVNQLPSDRRTGAPSAVAMAVCVKRVS